MMNIDRKKPSQTRLSLVPHPSSTSKFRTSIDRQSRSSITRTNEKIPFSEKDE
jgi:hypothetical protein